MAKKAITKEPDGTPVPTSIKLTCPFGFYDDAGNMKMWQPGQIVTDADEIATLLASGAEHEDLS